MRPFRARESAAKAAASKPPFSFSVEKEKAPFDGVKRKRLGGGIPDFARNARSAFYGGFGLVVVDGVDHSTEYGSCEHWGNSGMLPASVLLPQSGGCGGFAIWAGTLPRMSGCGSEKRTAEHPGGTRSSVGVKSGYRGHGQQRLPGQSPRNRAEQGVSNEV